MAKSNENTQNPSCCKFFTKTKEWIYAIKNKISNNVEETTTHRNLNRLRQQNKQIQQRKQETDYLETISKILGISAIFGTLIGGFFIYNYLNYLGQLSIFPEIITNPSALIATTIVFGLILLCFIMQFFLIFLCGYIKADKTISRILKYFCIIFFLSVFLVLTCSELCIIFLYIENIFSKLFLVFFVGSFDYIFYISGSQILNQRIEKNISNMIIFTSIFVILIIFIFNSNSALFFRSNHFVRFAESHENSSWYLLHNNFQQNNGSQETNGINKSDLKALKKRFYSNLCTEKGLKEHTLQYYSTPASRENALYGYMAWNLGDTKVFCPSYVNNKFSNINNQITDNCIVISGKALQIMPEGYISTEPIQQPKHDAKEYKIEINCCNCNHDSSKNEDNHPDIEYTDKKICQ